MRGGGTRNRGGVEWGTSGAVFVCAGRAAGGPGGEAAGVLVAVVRGRRGRLTWLEPVTLLVNAGRRRSFFALVVAAIADLQP